MARKPNEGWRLRWRNGRASVRFTWEKHDYCIALGTRSEGEASAAAARAYADVVSGRLRPLVQRPGQLLDLVDLWDTWTEWKSTSIDPETKKTLVIYGRRFVDYFKSLDRITEANGASYGMARLGQVVRETVLKELCFLRQFLAWCKTQGALASVPVIPALPPKARGKRSGKQRAKYVEISRDEARHILLLLPKESKTIGGRRWPIRDRFEFTWETMFRPETISRLSVPEHWQPGRTFVELDDEDDKARFGRVVDLTPRAVAILERCAPSSGPIFGRHEFAKVLKRTAKVVLGERAGQDFAPYDFRHGNARALLDAGAPLRGVGYLLGHLRPSTTDRYTSPDRRAGLEALRAARISGQYPDTGADRDTA
jgi:integrase